MNSILKKAAEFILQHHRRRRWFRVVTSLAMVVVFVTTYLLILPAITIERSAICGMEEHTHTSSCYEEYTEFVCNLDEGEEHEHDDGCYDTFKELVCGMEEHVHDDSCFETEVDKSDEDLTDGDLPSERVPMPDVDNDTTENGGADSGADLPDDDDVIGGTGSSTDVDADGNTDSDNEDDGDIAVGDTPVESTASPEAGGEETETSPAPSVSMPPSPDPTVGDIPQGTYQPSEGSSTAMPAEQSLFELPKETEVPKKRYCKLDEHEHTGDCFDEYGNKICGIFPHKHSNDCYGMPEIMLMSVNNIIDGAAYDFTINADASYTLTITKKGLSGSALNIKDFWNENRLAYMKYRITELVINTDATTVNFNDFAFSGCTSLEKVVVPDGAGVNINGAFSGCQRLTEFDLSKVSFVNFYSASSDATSKYGRSVEESGAFYDTGFKELYIPSTTLYIDKYTFADCKNLENVYFEENTGLTKISYGAFYRCSKLESINLENLKYPGLILDATGDWTGGMFMDCASLKEITIPGNAIITKLGSVMFDRCTSLEKVTFGEGCKVEATLGYNVPALGRGMFLDCASLKEIDLTNIVNLEEIVENAFQKSGIVSVAFPKSLKTLNTWTFAECTRLQDVRFEEGSRLERIENSAFRGSTALRYIDLESLENLKSISNLAFQGCRSLREVTLPESLTSLQGNAFENCTSLETVNIKSAKLTNVGLNMFNGVTGVTVNFCDTIDQIAAGVLNSLSAHASAYVFEGKNEFEITNGNASTGLSAPLDNLAKGSYYVSETGDLYKLESGNKATLIYAAQMTQNEFVVPEKVGMDGKYTVTKIGDYAFNLSGAASVGFENIDAITGIGDYAFAGGDNIASIKGHEYVEEVIEMFKEHGLNVPESAFTDTLLKGAVDSNDDEFAGEKIPSEDNSIAPKAEFEIYNDGDEWLTGQVDNVRVFVSNDGEGYVYRLYIEADPDCVFTKDQNLRELYTVPAKYHHIDGTNYYYFEIGPCNEGSTIEIPDYFHFTYPNSKKGGKVRIWAVGAPGDFWTKEYNDTVIFPDDEIEDVITTGEYFESVWTTEPDEHNVGKSAKLGKDYDPYARQNSDGTISVADVGYWIFIDDREGISYGADHIQYVVFKDTLKLPAGLKWRDGLAEAITAGHYRYNTWRSGDEYSEVYVTVDGMEYLLATIHIGQARSVTDIICEVGENGEITMKWTVKSPNTVNTAGIGYISQNLRYGPQVILYEDEEQEKAINGNGSTFNITNHVDAEEHFYFADPYTSSAEATKTATINANGQIKMEKSRLYEDKLIYANSTGRALFFGSKAEYLITIKNETPFKRNDVTHFTDQLETYHYMRPENIDLSISEAREMGLEFEAVIEHAEIAADIPNRTATAIDGSSEVELTVENTGSNHYYTGGASSDGGRATAEATIRIRDNGGIVTLTLSNSNAGRDGVYYIGPDQEYKTTEEALNAIGYLINKSTRYTLNWYTNGLAGGTELNITVHSTIKDSFMLLDGDNQQEYGRVSASGTKPYYPIEKNAASARNASNGSLASATVPDYKEGNTPMTLYVTPEIKIQKGFEPGKKDYSDENMDEDNVPGIKQGDVIDYSILVNNFGSDTSRSVLPIVDSMNGSQVIMALVSENINEPWAAEAKRYTREDGREYYLLMPYDEQGAPKEYKGVWFGEFYADSVTVTRESDCSISTVTKWYMKDTLSHQYSFNIEYSALFDAKALGCYETGNLRYDARNYAYLNDRDSDRLYDFKGGIQFQFEFEKHIIEERGASPMFDKRDEDDFTRIKKNTSVTYRLEMRAVSMDTVITGKDFFDALPSTAGCFTWEKGTNLSLEYVAVDATFTKGGETVDVAQLNSGECEEYSITDRHPSTGARSTGRWYVDWTDDFEISIPKGGQLYIYITLDYPREGEEWDRYYATHGMTAELLNSFYVADFPKHVKHQLVDTGRAFLQKGVYEIGTYLNKSNGGRASYFIGQDRFTYTNSLDTPKNTSNMRDGVVTYYLTLRNSSNAEMYLGPIYDKLPKGFTFYSLRSNPEGDRNSWSGVGCVNNAATSTNVQDGNSGHKTLATVRGAARAESASVYYTPAGTVDGCQMLKFDVRGTGTGIGYDEARGLYYLKPGYYIQFGYECITNLESSTEDIAHNAAAMRLVLMGQDYEVDTDSIVDVDNYNKLSPNNDGGRELWNNETAKEKGFNTGTADTKWLASEVDVYRGGEITPGITKTANKINIAQGKPAGWNVTAYNDGTKSITDYTIVDTIDAPMHFQGSLTYHSYTADTLGIQYHGVGNPNGVTNTGNIYGSLVENTGNYLLTFENKYTPENPSGDTVKIITNTGNNATFTLDPKNSEYGKYKEMRFRIKYENTEDDTVTAFVAVERDAEPLSPNYGTETFKIRFKDPRWSIPPNGYVNIGFETQNITGSVASLPAVYNNATFIPNAEDVNGNLIVQEYDESNVARGDNIKDDDGNNAGVTDMAYVAVGYTNPTSSYKEIVEKDSPVNSATSDDSDRKITLLTKDKEVTYNLTVYSSESKPMKSLVLIDNLPQENDKVTISSNVPRGSQFKVSLLKNPNFTLSVKRLISTGNGYIENEYPIPADKIKIQYSDKTDDFDDDDWKGKNTRNIWKDASFGSGFTLTDYQIANARSVRLVIDDVIPESSKVVLSFDARADESGGSKAEPREVAWNSFGYQYLGDNNGSEQYLFAAPLKVGITIPTIPYLEKRLVTSENVPIEANADKTFEFVIYEGEPVNFSSNNLSNVGGTLGFQYGRKFTYVKLTVPKGRSVSEKLPLDNLTVYKYEMGKGVTDTGEPWLWDFGFDANGNVVPTKYSIVELDSENEYSYLNTEIGSRTTTVRNSEFTYNPSANLSIAYTNSRSNWGVKLVKLDSADSSQLMGAVFGLYSPIAKEAIDEATVRRILSEAKVPAHNIPNHQIEDIVNRMKITHKGKTYYLAKIAITNSSGQISSWANALSGDTYLLTELRPPDGYYIDTSDKAYEEYREISYDKNNLLYSFTYTNTAGVELPKTGGSGMENAIKLLGITLMAFALSLYGVKFIRKRIG
ncbi:MAG: leucine-rich repeat protein [Oscillospiraceae bacterium]|nr:leucine-rich repeat protein [Oscillospiraceae bacterium]